MDKCLVVYSCVYLIQVEAYMDQHGTMAMPIYNLPSKILCRVMHVELKVSYISLTYIHFIVL